MEVMAQDVQSGDEVTPLDQLTQGPPVERRLRHSNLICYCTRMHQNLCWECIYCMIYIFNTFILKWWQRPKLFLGLHVPKVFTFRGMGPNHVHADSNQGEGAFQQASRGIKVWMKLVTVVKYLFSFTSFEVMFGWKGASSLDPNVFHAENSLVNPFILDSVGKFWGKALQIFPYHCLSSLELYRKYKKHPAFKVILFSLWKQNKTFYTQTV